MITMFIIWVFSLPRKFINLITNVYKKIKSIFVYLFIPDKKTKNKYRSRK